MTSYFVPIIILVAIAMIATSTPIDKEQPALTCPENEEYYKCSPIHCYKTCEHLIKNPPCPSVSSDCYIPACECKDGYYRNGQGTCIPIEQCENMNGQVQHIPY